MSARGAAILALALPIFDTAFVSVVRYFSGRAISQGGRDHTSHRLVAIGLSETRAVLMLWSISAAGGAVAYLLYNVGFSYAIYFAAIVILALVLFGVVLSRVRVYTEGAEPDGPASAFGFTLPGELVYKRQILWVLLDAVSVVLAANVALELLLPGSSPGLLVVTVAVLRPSGGAARSLTRTRIRMFTSSPATNLPIVTITVRPSLDTSPRVVVASSTSM